MLHLNFDSNHHLEHKRSVTRILFHRALTFITEDQDKETEMKHLRSVLQNNNYKPWIFKTPLGTIHKPKGTPNKGGSSISVPLPYIQGVSEQLTRVFRKQGVTTYHKPVNTIRQQLVYPKDPTPMEKKCGVVYKIQCGDCEEAYIGETARPFGVRFREHVKSTRSSTTAVGDHLRNTRHALDLSSSSIVVRENNTFKRRIRKAIEIHCQAPTLNRDVGYELSAIYRDVSSRDTLSTLSRDKTSYTT